MGSFTGSSLNSFKSASPLYSKIKREFKSFNSVNLIDELDFPLYTSEVLRELENGAYREEEAVIFIKNGQAALPKDFKRLYAAYRTKCTGSNITDRHFQNRIILEDDITCEVLKRNKDCIIQCDDDKFINKITINRYVNEDLYYYQFGNVQLLNLSPNSKKFATNDSLCFKYKAANEISINDGYIFTAFEEDAIFLQYYAFPYDEEGMPMIPDNIHVEKAVEWYIKWQILLNFWLVDDVSNVLNKWQKAEQLYNENLAEARHYAKVPAFSTLVNNLRDMRGINKFQAYSNRS